MDLQHVNGKMIKIIRTKKIKLIKVLYLVLEILKILIKISYMNKKLKLTFLHIVFTR